MKRRWMIVAELLALALIVGWAAWSMIDRSKPPRAVTLHVQLRDARDTAYLFRDAQGNTLYRIHETSGPGRDIDLTPEQFSARLLGNKQNSGGLYAILNVSSPVGMLWVALGLLGQVLFTGRMIVQWLISEKSKRSVVPPIFWWMSLGGGTMLLIYFLWRQDPIGVLGQSIGWFVYLRNLWMIYSPGHPKVSAAQDPGPEPELGE